MDSVRVQQSGICVINKTVLRGAKQALMTFIRMLSNKIMQCAMKVLCIHFMKDSLF